jgi:Rps23 Pro-64 3,4-dihydroxylase Tpa1-like proline 4-hydroxylase
VQHLGNGIYRIENFFSLHKKFKDLILNQIDNLDFFSYQNNPFKKNDVDSHDFLVKFVDSSNPILYEIVSSLNAQMLEVLNLTLNTTHVSQWEGSQYCGGITCYNPGNFFMDHNDLLYSDEEKKMTYTCVYYLNQDFEGGNLFFPELKITVKPIENSLVLLPSHLIHRAEEVISGNKIISATFFRETKNAN